MSKKKENTEEIVISNTKIEYYVIQEYQSKYDRWIELKTKHYLPKYEFGQHTASGACYQAYGIHGILDKKYALKYLAELRKALNDGTIKELVDDTGVTDFRVCKVSYKKKLTFVE